LIHTKTKEVQPPLFRVERSVETGIYRVNFEFFGETTDDAKNAHLNKYS
jgi:hypothetical protein